MIGDIYNLVLYSQTLEDGITEFTFEFDKPTNDIGGYTLYAGYNGIDYTAIKFRVDYKHYNEEETDTDYTYESGNKVYFSYSTTSTITDGRLLYFKFQAISESNELSNFSDVLQLYTAPSKPSNLLAVYDGYNVDLTWDTLDTSTGKNSSFTIFSIYRKNITEITDFVYEDNVIAHTDFAAGLAICVIDRVKMGKWFGEITTAGEFTLSDDNKITLASDNSEEYVLSGDNLRCLIEDPASSVLIDQAVSNSYSDSAFTSDVNYIYAVTSEGTDSKESEEIKFPIYAIDTEKSYPYLRSPGNSDTTILQQLYWKSLRTVLIDANYYDKTKFAIPYFEDTTYNLKGFLGVSNCNLDIFINNIYAFTTSTGDYGEFDIDYQFHKGETLISFQARDKFNIKFSRKSIAYSIRTINMYTWFAALGYEYEDIDQELEYIQNDVNITNARYSSFVDMYAPLIEMYKIGDEDETVFRNITAAVFGAFEYAAYDESLNALLDVFQENLNSFDHYAIHYNEDLYETQQTNYTFTTTSTGLERDDYYYGVSACKADGTETDVTEIRVDRRWWPAPFRNENVLMWDYMQDAECYKVYRGSTSTGLYVLTSTGYNFFVDINGYVPNTSVYPRAYNYTSLRKPTNLVLYDRYGVNNLFLRLKKPASLVIILYGRDSEELEDYNIQRLLILFEKFIPPEIKYRIIFANNEKVILYPEGTEVDLVEPALDYARYDESYYDNNEVYS